MFKYLKFSGDISLEVHENIKPYAISARQYDPSRAQKGDFFIHCLDGAALKIFFEKCNEAMPYQATFSVVLTEYASDARQLQIKGSLETLRLSSFTREGNMKDVSRAD